MNKMSCHLTAAGIILSTALGMGQQAKAEETYNANCKALGDGITLTSTGESVLEQRLVQFKPIERYKPQSGQRGVCIMRKDPLGFRWIPCFKKGEKFVTGDYYHPTLIRPAEAKANKVFYRGWSGACKVKL